MARNWHRPPNPGGYRPRAPERPPVPPPGGPWEFHERGEVEIPPRAFMPQERHTGRLVSRRKTVDSVDREVWAVYDPGPARPDRKPPPGMHICPITGAWRHDPPPRITSAALVRTVWGCVIVILGIVTWGITGSEWAILTLGAGCFLMSRTVVLEAWRSFGQIVLDTLHKGLEHDRHLRAIHDGVYRGPSESRPMQPGQMIDPRPQGSMMLPDDDVVAAVKAINEGGDLFEVWIVSKTKLSFDEWMDETIPETEE